jgi:prepilin-type processing-associated H-X9-DG protein
LSNSTVVNAQVNTFVCPSNPYVGVFPTCTNYGASYGPQFRWDATSGGVGVGLFAAQTARGINQVTDGTSNTVAFAEIKSGDNTPSSNGTEFFTTVSWPGSSQSGNGMEQVATNPTGAANLQKYIQLCDQARASRSNELDQGAQYWALSRTHRGATVSLLQTPNTPHADCFDTSTHTQSEYPNNGPNGDTASRSWHPGGVNVLFADGSVKFIKNSVSSQTWWALGTRSGGEVISSDQY